MPPISTIPAPVLRTVGDIAALYNRPLWVVDHLIRTRGLQHSARAGRYRLYNEATVQVIGQHLSARGGSRRHGD